MKDKHLHPTSPEAFAGPMLRLPSYDLRQMRRVMARKMALIDAELVKRGDEAPADVSHGKPPDLLSGESLS